MFDARETELETVSRQNSWTDPLPFQKDGGEFKVNQPEKEGWDHGYDGPSPHDLRHDLHELNIPYGTRTDKIYGTDDFLMAEEEEESAGQVLFMNPGKPLPAAPQPCPNAPPDRLGHLLHGAPASPQYDPKAAEKDP